MKLTKLIAILPFFVLFGAISHAQFSETIFYDTLTKVSSDGYVHSCLPDGKYLYVSGASFSQRSPLPTVTKMDTAGNVIWTATDEDNYGRFGGYFGFENSMASCRGTFKSGNRIFTKTEPAGYSAYNTLLHEVWCISDSTGILLWKLNINNRWIVRIADYSDTSIIAITRIESSYDYHLIHKKTGALIYSKHFGNGGKSLYNDPNVFVDNNKNILLSWDDTCRKFRDDRLNQLVWTSNIRDNGSLKMIDLAIQSDNRYYFSGQNNVRCVDTSTGATVWYNQYDGIGFVRGVQSGNDCRPKDVLIKDSLIYVTWTSEYVGGVELGRGFTLTRMNKTNGYLKYMVAYDFSGTPPDKYPSSVVSELDWPFKICIDNNNNIYMVGSYDRDPGQESTGSWGIMRINGETGDKLYEATITDDPSRRAERSQGKFVYYFDGKLYAVGNLEKPSNTLYARPVMVSFDTTAFFHERFRKGIDAMVRYSSSLKSILPFSSSKLVLLKKIGRSSIVELRTNANQLLWSKTFNNPSGFIIPQNITAMADTGIAASFILYKADTSTRVFPTSGDSLLFVQFDTIGNLKFSHSIKYNLSDTLNALQVYKDDRGKINFIYRQQNGPNYMYAGYMLGGKATALSQIGNSVSYDENTSFPRINVVQNFNIDTMICYQVGRFSNSALLHSTSQTSGYPYFGQRQLRYFEKIYSSLKLDSVSFFVMGRDSSGQIRGARYNHRLANPLVWSYTPVANGTLFNADSSSRYLYTLAMGSPAKKVIVTKIDRLAGGPIWNFERTPAAKANIQPVDLKYNLINRHFTIGGYIVDSSRSGNRSSYFYISIDSTGAIFKDLVQPGFGLGETKINVIENLQNGTEIFGGSINVPDYGTVGFYNSDCAGNTILPSVSIRNLAGSFCSGLTITFIADAINGGSAPRFEWKVNGVTAGENTSTFSSSTLVNGAQVQAVLTSNGSCLQSPTAISNTIPVSILPASIPSAIITGVTVLNPGQATSISVSAINGGSAPTFQWQDSTVTHSWQNIPGAINKTIVYAPAATGSKLRCQLNSNLNCATPVTVLSNPLSFTVNTVTAVSPTPAIENGIIYYPNPLRSNLIIDSLRLFEAWETIVITTLDGRNVMGIIDIRNKKTVSINLAHLPAGIYVGVLNRKNRGRVYIKFQKM